MRGVVNMSIKKKKSEIDFIKDELLKKGFPLENYVQSLLFSKKWYVTPNAYFVDKDTKTGRELDIKASQDYSCSDDNTDFSLTLLIQCKKIPGNAWVFFSDSSQPYYQILKYDLNDFLDIGHHSLLGKIGTHFEKSEVTARNYCEVIIDENKSNRKTNNIWNCAITLIKATSQEFDDANADCKMYLERDIYDFEEFADSPSNVIDIFYPVIVFEGKIFEAQFSGNEVILNERDQITLFIDYKSGKYAGKFHIDVLKKEKLSDYLSSIECDIASFDQQANKNSKRFHKELLLAVKNHLKKLSINQNP